MPNRHPTKTKPVARTRKTVRSSVRTRSRGAGERKRRRPEEAAREILDAAEKFLRTRPFRDLQVWNLMDQTGLTRSAFYHYFVDRHELVVRLTERLARELAPMNEVWFEGGGDPLVNLRLGYEGVGEFWAQHGPVLRALADAATHDRKVEKAYRAFVDHFARRTAERIRRDIAAGLIRELDADETARALILMSERYLSEHLGSRGARDWRPVVATLVTIWQRALYGQTR